MEREIFPCPCNKFEDVELPCGAFFRLMIQISKIVYKTVNEEKKDTIINLHPN